MKSRNLRASPGDTGKGTEETAVSARQDAQDSRQPPLAAILAGFATIYLVWGSTYLAIRVAVETMPPFLLASARFILAGLILMAYLLWRGRFHADWKQWRDNSIIGAFMLLGGNGLVVWAEEEVPSGIATLIISTNPIFVVIGEWLLAAGWWQTSGAASSTNASANSGSTSGYQRAGWLTWTGLTLGLVGLWLLVDPSGNTSSASQLDLLRVAALVLACISWTIGTFATRQVTNPADPFTGAAIQMLAGGVWLGAVGAGLGELQRWDWATISIWSWLAWSYLLVAGSLIAFTTFIWLTRHCSPTLVSTYAYVNPIVAVLLGWLILSEPITPQLLLAAIVIILSVAAITLARRPPSPRSGR